MIISEQQRVTALAALAGCDPLDALATIAALQLIPENANALARLEGAAGVATGLAPSPGGAAISDETVLAWVNRPLFADSDSPFNNTFTDEFIFHGGSFVVFPGLREDAFFVVRMLARAVLHSPGSLDHDLFRAAQSLAAATLMTSDAIARKAGLGRGVEARPQDSIYASAAAQLDTLMQAVAFTADELGRWLRPLEIDVLSPLVQELPVGADHARPAHAPLYRPIVRDGDRLVVAAPHLLLPALSHAVLELAHEQGQLDVVGSEFRDSVYSSTLLAARYMDWEEIDGQLPERGDLSAHESVFLIDRDKLAHVLVVTDDLQTFDGEPFSVWETDSTSELVEERLREVRDHLLALPQEPQSLLQLVVIQPLDRDSYFLLDDGDEIAQRLLLTAAELETIPLVEGGQALLLWKYARSRARLAARTHVSCTSELDLFHIYRDKDDSFYLSDDPAPRHAEVAREGVRALREEVQQTRDLHGAPYINRTLVEVMSKEATRAIPIYFVMPPPPDRRGAVLVEGYDLPVWVFAHTPIPDGYAERYTNIVEMLAYWVWRFTPSLTETCQRLEERCHQLYLEVDLVQDDAWHERPDPDAIVAPDDIVECSSLSRCRLRIRLWPAFLALVDGPDNRGERELMRRVVGGIVDLELEGREGGEPVLDDAAIDAAVDEHAPLGLQKMMVSVDAALDPTLDNRGIGGARFVQGDDDALAMDELGEYLIDEKHLPIGDIPAEQRTDVLNAAVAFHMRQLGELVATLSPIGLLEWLVLANEALTVEYNRVRIEIPTRQACFSDVADVRRQLVERIPKSATANVANRFLIEYIAAKPPNGSTAMSKALYDRLLAISAQLHSRGFLSDLIHFKLEDASLSILPSRRLGIDRDTTYREGHEAYLGDFAQGEVARSVDLFPRFWETREEQPPPNVADLDEALEAEVGLTLTQVRDFFGAVFSASVEREEQVKVAAATTLIDELRAELAWPHDLVERAFDLFALRPRDSFAPPGEPFELADVYPWRFNRALSYVRRPLVVRPTKDGEEVVWGLRHTYLAHMYFGSLVIEGRWKNATSTEMRSLVGKIHNEEGRAFNDAVADLFEEDPALIVKRQVTKIGGLRIERAPGQDLGDIDVLVADLHDRRLQAVEAKDLAVARTPAELDNELQETFKAPEGRRPAAIERHVERVEWLRDHIEAVLEWLGVDDDATLWEVEGLVVVDFEMMSPYLVDLPLPVRSYRGLRDELRASRGGLGG